MSWIYLSVAIIFEVAGTLSIKQILISHNNYLVFLVILFYAISFLFVGMSAKKLEIGVVYAVWAGVGTALITILGVLIFKESISLVKILAIVLILIGVVLLKYQYN